MKQLELDLPEAGYEVFILIMEIAAQLKNEHNADLLEAYLPTHQYHALYRYLYRLMREQDYAYEYKKGETNTLHVGGVPIYSSISDVATFHTQMCIYSRQLIF